MLRTGQHELERYRALCYASWRFLVRPRQVLPFGKPDGNVPDRHHGGNGFRVCLRLD
jgi:hypothetical protein